MNNIKEIFKNINNIEIPNKFKNHYNESVNLDLTLGIYQKNPFTLNVINKATMSKGKIYKIKNKNIYFINQFIVNNKNNKPYIEWEVDFYNSNLEYLNSDTISFKQLSNFMIKNKLWEHLPIEILGIKTNILKTIIRKNNNISFIFKDHEYIIKKENYKRNNYENDYEHKQKIEKFIQNLEKYGYKGNILKKVKNLFPEYYQNEFNFNNESFIKSIDYILKIIKKYYPNDYKYIKSFFEYVDESSRTGNKFLLDENSFTISGYTSNLSDSYFYKSIKFKKEEFTNEKNKWLYLVKLLNKNDILDFIIAKQKRKLGYMQDYTNYVLETGNLD